ncbi:MAG: hypothetical protein JW909_13140 [Planctomycetes bacterium]|nr:hypothetical protein [Planctomycetota bacterium]
MNKLAIARFHGLGDLVLLLPILDRAHAEGYAVSVATRHDWAAVFAVLRPRYAWTSDRTQGMKDLDALTMEIRPTEHRTDEFARLLGISGPFDAPWIEVPLAWRTPFERFAGCVVFAPEAEHEARRAPEDWAAAVAGALLPGNVVLAGRNNSPALPCTEDLRGTLSVKDLFGLLASAGSVVCMDSGVLHVAAAAGAPTVAVFGGVDPRYRIRPSQKVLALQADMECCPCNKNETCGGTYDCLKYHSPADVARAVRDVAGISHMHVRTARPA